MGRVLAHSRERSQGSAEPGILCARAPLYTNFPEHLPYSNPAKHFKLNIQAQMLAHKKEKDQESS